MTCRRGFTMIELLVVMGILVVLVGIIVPTTFRARRNAKVSQTASMIQQMSLALANYETEFGDYPPSTLKDCGLTVNKQNDGIESLVACLSTMKKNGPYYDFDEDRLANADGDRVPDFNDSYLKKGLAYEYLDPWGNPFIYFHNRDYQSPEIVSKYRVLDKTTFKAIPQKSEKTGNWHGFDSFQLWSAGPDGKNEDGEGDDITSWDTN